MSVVTVTQSCQGLDLCGQCPIEVLVLDKNSNPTTRGNHQNGVFDEEVFNVPDCSRGL